MTSHTRDRLMSRTPDSTMSRTPDSTMSRTPDRKSGLSTVDTNYSFIHI